MVEYSVALGMSTDRSLPMICADGCQYTIKTDRLTSTPSGQLAVCRYDFHCISFISTPVTPPSTNVDFQAGSRRDFSRNERPRKNSINWGGGDKIAPLPDMANLQCKSKSPRDFCFIHIHIFVYKTLTERNEEAWLNRNKCKKT